MVHYPVKRTPEDVKALYGNRENTMSNFVKNLQNMHSCLALVWKIRKLTHGLDVIFLIGFSKEQLQNYLTRLEGKT